MVYLFLLAGVDISVVAGRFLSRLCEAVHSGSRWQSLVGKGKGLDAGLGACTDWLLLLKFLWCWTAIKVSLLLLSLLNCGRDTTEIGKKKGKKRTENVVVKYSQKRALVMLTIQKRFLSAQLLS